MIVRTFKIDSSYESSVYSELEYTWFENISLNRDLVIISDSNVYKLYPEIFVNHKYIILNPGEECKSFDTIIYLINKFIELEIDRNSVIIGFGGGVICDITGFAANIYMRGVKFGFIPSTLLAQVDASIGGKNGINFGSLKNYVGNISQPEFIICDSHLLKTLSEPEYKSGLGEVIKYALIHDPDLFESMSDNYEKLNERDTEYLNSIVRKCIDIKINIVKKDPYDMGSRQILNFGHTFGHAFELIDSIPHGLAVIKGISVAIDLSLKFEYASIQTIELIKNCLKELDYDIDYNLTSEHFKILIKDKKKNKEDINFVFLREIGEVEISKVKIKDLISVLS